MSPFSLKSLMGFKKPFGMVFSKVDNSVCSVSTFKSRTGLLCAVLIFPEKANFKPFVFTFPS